MPKCEKCDKEFKTDIALKIHAGRMHGAKKAKSAPKKAKAGAKAGTGAFACEACGRTFKMAAHLARHASIAHGKAEKAKKALKVGKPAGKIAVVASAGLGKIPASVLQAELQRRAKKASKKLPKLLRQRANLDAQIAELEAIKQ
jgi:uncharacterized C2H2 Zn-finger protein